MGNAVAYTPAERAALAAAICAWRAARALTQQQAADAVGVSKRCYQLAEDSRYGISPATVRKWQRAAAEWLTAFDTPNNTAAYGAADIAGKIQQEEL